MKKKYRFQASRKAMTIVLIDKGFILLFFLLYIKIQPQEMVWMWGGLAVLTIYQGIMLTISVAQFVKPLEQLETVSDFIEKHEGVADGAYFGQSVAYLITCVKKAIRNEYNSQMMKSQAEIHALQSQINPHFLYNTLEIIRSQAIQRDSWDIAEMTEALATLFRYSISRPGEMATLEEELENVKNYLLIQQYRFPSKFSFHKEIEEEGLLIYRIPILTIQPIVENAIHHGLETKLGTGSLVIRIFRTREKLIIQVRDDGSGMGEKQLEELQLQLEHTGEMEPARQKGNRHVGIALINVNQRLKFYFGAEYGLKVQSTLGVGTIVNITLPVTEREKVETYAGGTDPG